MNFLQKIKLFPYAMKGYLFSSPEKNGEYKFLNQIFSNLSEDKLVFDVGANVGNYSSKILEITRKVKIHCFEPVPRTFSSITQKLFEVKNVYLNNIALSDKEGKSNMYEYGELSGVNSLEYHPNVNQKNTKIIKIEQEH